MTITLSAREIKLRDLSEKFNLHKSENPDFFTEWHEPLPELTDRDRELLNEIRADYDHLLEDVLLESAVKMLVISPLLRMAGMYRAPFYFNTEKSVEITSQDGEITVRGRIDALVFTPEFWVLAIEAKNTEYSLAIGIPQLLTYMLDAPHENRKRPVFGWVTNGRDFQFVKLKLAEKKSSRSEYALSNSFCIDNDHDLDHVLQILKKLAALSG